MKHHTEAEKRLGVRIHAIAYAATVLVLIGVNLLTGRPYWIVWVIPPWTIGLLCHWYFAVGRGLRSA